MSTGRTDGVPQYGLGVILFMFAWPAAWYGVIIYLFAPMLVGDSGYAPSWVVFAVMVLGGGAEGTVALVLLRREGYALTLAALGDRIRWRWPQGTRAWVSAVAVFVIAFALSVAAGPLNKWLAGVPGFVPPSWYPPAANPTVEIKGVQDAFPDIALSGNYVFLLAYIAVPLIFNIVCEELYYRGFLLPRMNGAFGRWDWLANGILFTAKHAYQRWLWPGILVGGLAFAFAAGPLGSLPLAMAFHWLGNFLLSVILLAAAVF